MSILSPVSKGFTRGVFIFNQLTDWLDCNGPLGLIEVLRFAYFKRSNDSRFEFLLEVPIVVRK